jgi:hypothetical protein
MRLKVSLDRFYALYVLAIFFICLGYLSILPPFEGFDETAHLSSILEVSTGKFPYYGVSSIDKRLVEYSGPRSYHSGLPPFDANGAGYKNFFSNTNSIELYKKLYIPGSSIIGYQPSGADVAKNWQAQHPPAYYFLMSWTPDFFSRFNFLEFIFTLRLISVSFFILAVVVFIKGVSETYSSINVNCIKVGLLFYPMLVPMLFFDIARIGNDSLCLLICALVAYLIPKLIRNWSNSVAIYIGALLGLGLLTKAFFLPIGFGILIFLAFEKSSEVKIAEKIPALALVFLTMGVISFWWYLRNYYEFGSFTGSDEFISLDSKGGLISNLKIRFTFYEFFRGLFVPIVSFIWAGSGSLVRMPYLFIIPLLFINLIIFLSYISHIRKKSLIFSYDSLFLLIFSIFYLSLVLHMIHVLALYGRGTTPGWYLNILFPWAVPAVGFGIISLLKKDRIRTSISNGAYIFLGVFQIIAIYFLVTLYSGCSYKGYSKLFEFQSQYVCLDNLGLIYERMNLIGFPILGMSCLAIGFSLLFFLYFKTMAKIK